MITVIIIILTTLISLAIGLFFGVLAYDTALRSKNPTACLIGSEIKKSRTSKTTSSRKIGFNID